MRATYSENRRAATSSSMRALGSRTRWIRDRFRMTQFTILHHGVPLGTAFTTPSDEEGGNPFALNMMDFTPAPAYESVRRLTRHAADAFCGWFIGPLVDWEAAEKDLP